MKQPPKGGISFCAPGGTCTPEGHRPRDLQSRAFAAPPPTQYVHYAAFFGVLQFLHDSPILDPLPDDASHSRAVCADTCFRCGDGLHRASQLSWLECCKGLRSEE